MAMIITVDIGGTKTLVAVFDETMNIVESTKFKTPTDYSEFLAKLTDSASSLSTHNFRFGSIGTRGIIDREKGEMVQDSGVLNWNNAPLVADCETVFGCKFSIENDSKLAGLSEARILNGTYKKIVYVTISTGIGSAYIADGQLDQNTINSEVGKWAIESDGQVKTWEETASGSWIKEAFGKLASELDDPEAWSEISRRLALGFINICAAYTPDLIIIGGGVGEHLDKFKEELEEKMTTLAHPMIKLCPIKKAQNPEEAVIYGCFYHANDKFNN